MEMIAAWLKIQIGTLHKEGTVSFVVHVVPRSRTPGIAGLNERHELRVKVSEPPEAGRANSAVCSQIASLFSVSPRLVTITKGMTSRRKLIRVNSPGSVS